MELETMIKSEGYGNIRCLWYWIPKLSFTRGLRPLNNDQDILTFIEDVKGYNVIDVYVEHPIEIPEFVDAAEIPTAEIPTAEIPEANNPVNVQAEGLNVEADVNVQAEELNMEQDVEAEELNVEVDVNVEQDDEAEELNVEADVNVEQDADVNVEDEEVADVNVEDEQVADVNVEDEQVADVNVGEDESETDSDYEPNALGCLVDWNTCK
jgi:hypothetical protein